ncbi:MAG: CBS domain-containing protein [Pseudomonadota bacterium]
MKHKKVNELMIPLSEYATVKENDTLEKAIKTLKKSQTGPSSHTYPHRAVLVYDKNGKITGKVSSLDVLRALEPKYCQFGHTDQIARMGLSRFGLSHDFLHSLVENYCLWEDDLESLIKTASKLKVKEIMHSPHEGEYVNEDMPVSEAIHQFILGHHQSLLVLKNENVIGILRLTDIFKLVCDLMINEA